MPCTACFKSPTASQLDLNLSFDLAIPEPSFSGFVLWFVCFVFVFGHADLLIGQVA